MNKILAKLEFTSLLFILSTGISSFYWFLVYLLGYNFSLISLSIALIFGILSSIFLIRSSNLKVILDKEIFLPWERYTIILISTLIILAILVSSYSPIVSWDSLTLYDFRGLIIAQSHSLSDISLNTYYLSYPLMTSLVHAAFYMLGSHSPQIFYALIYASFIFLTYGRMRAWTTRHFALISSLLVATTPFLWQHATISYTNLPYTIFLVGGLLYAPSSLLLSGVLIGLSTWVRMSEPFWIVGLLLIAFYGWTQKQKIKAIFGILLAFAMRMTWTTYLSSAYTQANLILEDKANIYNIEIFAKIYANIGTIISYLWEFIITPYFGFWVLAVFSFLPAIIFRSKLYMSFVLLISMTIIGTAVFSTYFESWYSIGGSATRMILFIAPLSTIVGVRLYYLLKVKNVKNIK